MSTSFSHFYVPHVFGTSRNMFMLADIERVGLTESMCTIMAQMDAMINTPVSSMTALMRIVGTMVRTIEANTTREELLESLVELISYNRELRRIVESHGEDYVGHEEHLPGEALVTVLLDIINH